VVALAQPKTRRRTHGVVGPATTSREARLYNLQNWRADVVVTTDANGVPVDHTRYNAYGVARKVNVSLADVASDGLDRTYNPNGSVGPEDIDAFTAAFTDNNLAVADVATDSMDASRNPNGSVGLEDQNAFIAAYIAGTGTTVKRGVLESGGIDSGLGGNWFGYAGYELDPAMRGPGTVIVDGVPVIVLTQTMYHVRHRVYDTENGRLTKHDPLGYVDGMGLYEYCGGRPEEFSDPDGLQAQPLPVPSSPGLPSSPLRFPGDPMAPFRFTPSPTLVPAVPWYSIPTTTLSCANLPLVATCVVVDGTFLCIGYAICELLPDPAPIHIGPGKWATPEEREREAKRRSKDCSPDLLAILIAAQNATCVDSNGKETYDPCAQMRSKYKWACRKEGVILGCVMAREAVNAYHLRCDVKTASIQSRVVKGMTTIAGESDC